MSARTCIACGAEEIRTYRCGTRILQSTTIEPTSGLCINCLPRRASAAPAGALFDRVNADSQFARRFPVTTRGTGDVDERRLPDPKASAARNDE